MNAITIREKLHTGRISNAQSAAEELSRIARACGGKLTPEDVVRNAASETSPIHNYFEWDDSVAAERYRLVQAGQLIRTIKVTIETHPQDEPLTVRAFVNVSVKSDEPDNGTENSVYVPLSKALEVDDYRIQMLENAAKELGAFRRKYAVLQELSGVLAEIDKLQLTFGEL